MVLGGVLLILDGIGMEVLGKTSTPLELSFLKLEMPLATSLRTEQLALVWLAIVVLMLLEHMPTNGNIILVLTMRHRLGQIRQGQITLEH
jgi:hypothetical protein